MVSPRLRRGSCWRVFLRNELAGLRANGLTVELKEAWDELRARWPWSQGLNYGSKTRPMVGPGSDGPFLGCTGPGGTSVLASMDSRGGPSSEPDNASGILRLTELALATADLQRLPDGIRFSRVTKVNLVFSRLINPDLPSQMPAALPAKLISGLLLDVTLHGGCLSAIKVSRFVCLDFDYGCLCPGRRDASKDQSSQCDHGRFHCAYFAGFKSSPERERWISKPF
jgi:hypothetical protein